MKNELCLKRLLVLFLLPSFIFISFFASEDTLLCFGKDGHVAIEFVDACNRAGFESQLTGVESDNCGPCRDVQILSSPAYTRNASRCIQSPPTMFLFAMSLSLPSKEYYRPNIDFFENSHHKTLSSLHSVVLLI